MRVLFWLKTIIVQPNKNIERPLCFRSRTYLQKLLAYMDVIYIYCFYLNGNNNNTEHLSHLCMFS